LDHATKWLRDGFEPADQRITGRPSLRQEIDRLIDESEQPGEDQNARRIGLVMGLGPPFLGSSISISKAPDLNEIVVTKNVTKRRETRYQIPFLAGAL